MRARGIIDCWLGKLQIVLAFLIAAFGAVLKAKLDDLPWQWLYVTVDFMQRWAWAVAVVGPVALAITQFVRRKFGNPWALDAVQKLLDEIRREMFGEHSQDPLDHHRVTLFKRVKWRGFLIAVARSDHLTKNKIRRFRVSDDGELCEGVVGRAWRCSEWVIVPSGGIELPTLKRHSASGDIEAFAAKTHVDPKWVRKQLYADRPLAMSYAAILVRLKGQPWGVLVLDSRNPKPIDREKLAKFGVYGSLLTPLLERI